ncbi:monocarboxylate transporter 12-like [Ptychodera flava]|uniref:monocarboxylate transporter 12-like n=1 Tax=Ptychodera flava TaxID=63121 RepID=UPI003969DA60
MEKLQTVFGRHDRPPDGGWGWMVALACFLGLVICTGVSLSTGVMVSYLTPYFGTTVTAMSTAFSLEISVWAFSSPVGSFIAKYDTRKAVVLGGVLSTSGLFISSFATGVYFLYFSFGILVGCGYGMTSSPLIAVLGRYFEKKVGFATALALTGSSLGYIVFSPLYQYLLNEYGWRSTFLVTSAINAHLFVCAALVRPINLASDKTLSPAKNSEKSSSDSHFPVNFKTKLRRLLEKVGCEFMADNLLFLWLLLATFLGDYSYVTASLFIVPYAIDKGIASLPASFLMTILGISSLASRFVFSWIVDLHSVKKIRNFIPAVILLMISSCLTFFPMNDSYTIMAVLCSLTGVCSGIYMPSLWLMAKEVCGPYYGMAVGVIAFSFGLSGISGPPFCGYLYDTTNTYTGTFYAIVAVTLLSVTCYLGIATKLLHRPAMAPVTFV